MTQKVHKLTRERFTEYENELKYLKSVREKEVADQIAVARSFGDLSENSEYDEAKNEQGKLYSHIAEVEDILAHAVIIDEEGFNGVAEVGTHVTIEVGGREYTYKIVGSNEANPAELRISDESPLGKALIGKKMDDKASYEAPSGVTVNVIIKSVTR